jgi:hypothetical protein
MMIASKATAPTTIPAIAPVEGPELRGCIWAGVTIGGLDPSADVPVEVRMVSYNDDVEDVGEVTLVRGLVG